MSDRAWRRGLQWSVLAASWMGCAPANTMTSWQTEMHRETLVQQDASQPRRAVCPTRSGTGEPAFLVAGERGVMEVTREGSVLRTLSTTPAAYARRVPGKNEIVFLANEQRELRALSLDDCGERVIVRLPKSMGPHCNRAENPDVADALHIEDDHDIAFTRTGALCLQMGDRALTSATEIALVQVDVEHGTLKSEVVTSNVCNVSATHAEGFVCMRLPPMFLHPLPPPPPMGGYNVKDAEIRQMGPPQSSRERFRWVVTARMPLGDFAERELSPSRRWMIVYGNREEGGDTVRWTVFLFDRLAGKLYPVREGDVSTPVPVSAYASAATLLEHGRSVVNETTVRFLGIDDLVQVGDLIVDPGKTGFRLPGAIAY